MRAVRLIGFVSVCALAVSHASGALAQSTPTLQWQPTWTRFTPTQYALTGAMGGVLAFGSGLYAGSGEPKWSGPILFDSQARSALVAGSPTARANAGKVSDYLMYGLIAYPMIDSLAVAGAAHQSPDVAFQMSMISLQATFASALLSGITKTLVGRERPDVARCDAGEEQSCGAQSRSFFSGHTSAAFTGAGLTCAHHQNLRLYGNASLDLAACVVSLAAAAAVGTLRVVADRHHLSDVLTGAAVGLTSGYVVPNVVNYDFGRSAQRSGSLGSFGPLVGDGAIGVQMVGQF